MLTATPPSTAEQYRLVCTTPELKRIYDQGYKEAKTGEELSIRSLDYPLGSKELLAYTIGHMASLAD